MAIDFRKFDKRDTLTAVRLDLLAGRRDSLKALAAASQSNGFVRGEHRRRCRLCRLRIRGPNHEDGHDHIWREPKK